MNWSDIEISHVRATSFFGVSKGDELKEVFCWKKTQPLLNQDNQRKGTNCDFLDYHLEFIEAYQSFKCKRGGI